MGERGTVKVMWFGISILVGGVPAAVGLALVHRHPGRGRWRTWGLLGFALGLVSTVGQVGVSAMVFSSAGAQNGLDATLYGSLSMAFQVMSLIAAGCIVAAVVTDRREVPEAGTAAEQQPCAEAVLADDPLAYDPVDFEPPRRMS